VARNRQRAKERRARQSPQIPGDHGFNDAHDDEAPEPLEHAAPYAELAAAQEALGRPDLVRGADASDDAYAAEAEDEEEFGYDEPPPGGGGDGRGGGLAELPGGAGGDGARLPVGPLRAGGALINFLQGSWRELQRVQWPDRRQVIQATGVVLGFVIVAGVFLGVADFLATKLMNYILTGHS
jgi:preprotein translocase subunit SecE